MGSENKAEDIDNTRVTGIDKVAECLDVLMGPAGASLLLVSPGFASQPVVIHDMQEGERLHLDVSSAGEIFDELKFGQQFYLLGYRHGDLLRSSELTMTEIRESGGQLHGFSDYPCYFDIIQHRANYRAELRLGMVAFGTLTDVNRGRISGVLRDLSLGGCQLRLPVAAVNLIGEQSRPLLLTLLFPDGTELTLEAVPRHEWVNLDRGEILAGFKFDNTTPAQERQLWVLVREIERESARYLHGDSVNFQPSSLFAAPRGAVDHLLEDKDSLATPMARRLVRVAEYIGAQLLQLRRGEAVDSVQLSLHADRLLGLLDEDREEVLFAAGCLHHQPPLIQHCLTVALRLADLVSCHGFSAPTRKAVTACALLHDLGRPLMQGGDMFAPPLAEHESEILTCHVATLKTRLLSCRWLPQAVVEAVIAGGNERLDGSGYPRGLRGDQLNDLSRMMMVVDAVDIMTRGQSGKGHAIDAAYDELSALPERYDLRWLQAYRQHFGELPIGTLVRFSGGQLAWVRYLDDAGRLNGVQLASDVARPTADNLGAWLEGVSLAALDRPQALPLP